MAERKFREKSATAHASFSVDCKFTLVFLASATQIINPVKTIFSEQFCTVTPLYPTSLLLLEQSSVRLTCMPDPNPTNHVFEFIAPVLPTFTQTITVWHQAPSLPPSKLPWLHPVWCSPRCKWFENSVPSQYLWPGGLSVTCQVGWRPC